MREFLWGGCAMLSAVAALYFWKFFRTTGDRLFATFCLAFGSLALHWTALAWITPHDDTRHYFYVLRLIAFLLILFAVVEKNRKRGDEPRSM